MYILQFSYAIFYSNSVKAMQSRADEYGPVVFEKIGHIPHVIVSDPKEYTKVMRVDGKYPHRIEMEPLAYYRRKKGMCLGTVSG